MRKLRRTPFAIALTVASVGIVVSPTPATAAEFVVVNIDDDGDGSLRDALDKANDTTAPDTITFAPGVAGTIVLAATLPVDESVDIVGPGSNVITLDGQSTYQVFAAQADLSIEGLTITNGASTVDGAAIGMAAGDALTVSDMVFENNESQERGGAIGLAAGTLQVTGSEFTGNVGKRGGAIWSTGPIAVDGTDFTANSSAEGGGAVAADSTASIEASSFTENRAVSIGGAIRSIGGLTLTDSTFVDNDADESGGALALEGASSITNSTFEESDTTFSGGAIRSSDDLTIDASTFESNSSAGDGGAIWTNHPLEIDGSTFTGQRSLGGGGAIWTSDQSTILASTFEANSAEFGGAILSSNDLDLVGTTFTVNEALNGSGGAIWATGSVDLTTSHFETNSTLSGDGGAVYSQGARVEARFTSFVGNEALDGNGGAVRVADARLQASGTLFEGNSASADGGAIAHFDAGELTISFSSLIDNTSGDDGGGVVADVDSVGIYLSTISGNTAEESGGGLHLAQSDPDDEVIAFSTISRNEAGLDGGGAYFDTPGTLDHTIVADNDAAASPDVWGVADADWSLIGTEDGATIAGVSNVFGDPLLGELVRLTVDLDDSPFGFSFTPVVHTPMLDSPAIDAGNPNPNPFVAFGIDQRGFARPEGLAADIGSVEIGRTDRPAWSPITPVRLLDTRESTKPNGGTTTEVQVSGRGGIPDSAASVIVNVTAVSPETNGFVTIWDCADPLPTASSLNHTTGVNLGNETVAALSSDGTLCMFTSATTHLTVDAVAHLDGRGPFRPVPPARLVDTRSGRDTVDGRFAGGGRRIAGTELRLQVADRAGVAEDASAVAMNVTAIGAETTGFITVHACEPTRPLASSLNYVATVNRGNEIIAELDDSGVVCIYTSAAIDLTVDVTGFLVAGSDAQPVPPARLLDSRSNGATVDAQNQGGGQLAAGAVTMLVVGGRAGVPDHATTATMNITAVNPSANGFITAYRCSDPRPLTSNLNYTPGVNGGNDITVGLEAPEDGSASTICLYNSSATDLTADIAGYTTR